ncbi:MAG TPA: cellulase family glycosylhydrolase, partial [Cellvibrionaceae bacterium]
MFTLSPFTAPWVLRSSALCALLIMSGCGSSGGGTPDAPPPMTSSSTASSSSTPAASSVSSSAQSSSSANAITLCGFEDTVLTISHTEATRLEAENFDACEQSFADSTNTNSGGAYRDLAVDINAHEVAEDGFYITQMVEDEYLEYSVNVTRSGFYSLTYRVQPNGTPATYRLSHAGVAVDNSEVSLDASNSWQDATAQQLYLSDGPQILRLEVVAGGADLDYLEFAYSEALAITPHDAVSAMGIGINLGNTLDAPSEGAWAQPAQKQHFQDFTQAGFKHVRIPATWDNHTAESSPYTITQARLDRTEQIVDWALAEGLYVILNAHHEHWLSEGYNSSKQARFNAMWTQIAARFQHKSAR